MVTNNSINVATAATGTLLAGAGVGTAPTFTAFPQVSGLGVGASPGSTAGITFDGTNFLDAYSTGTWTPTLDGTVSGTTTYVRQTGYYTRIGTTIFLFGNVGISAATGTGSAMITGLPFTIKSQANYTPPGSTYFSGAAAWVWPVGTTYLTPFALAGTSQVFFYGSGSTSAGNNLQMANGSLTIIFSLVHQI